MLPALRNNASSLAPWAPANRLASLFDRFLNEDFFTPVANQVWTAGLPTAMWEDEHNVYVEIDAPGLAAGDIDLAVHQGDLVIRGERKCERKEGVFDSRRYGRFEQRITLPADVAADNVEAKLANGVLTVTLPKSPESQPRKIAVQAE
jgi:HSP20 family protein